MQQGKKTKDRKTERGREITIKMKERIRKGKKKKDGGREKSIK